MCENGNVSFNKEDKIEIIDESVTTDLNPTVYNDILCRLCRLPKIGSNLVRELRGCNCDKVQPYHKHSSDTPRINLDVRGPIPVHRNESQLPHNPEISITGNLAGPRNDDMRSPKDRPFEPPQGMDTGEYPRALFHQYYPSRQKSYTFNLLPLPFMEKLEYETMRALSMENKDIREKWKDFLYNLPDGEFRTVPYPDDKFWRWKNRLRYKPDDGTIEFRKKMQTGPKYDRIGRFPITGEELNMFRKSGCVQQRPKVLRKGDGTRKIESHRIIP